MNLDQGFVYALIQGEQSIAEAINSGVDSEFLRGPWAVACKFSLDYYREHGKAPSTETVTKMTGVSFDGASKEPMSFWVKEAQNRFVHEQVSGGLNKVADALDRKDGFGALEKLEDLVRKSYRIGGEGRRIESIFSLKKQVIEEYHQAKKGLTGIPTPWPSMDRATLGWQPQEFSIFASRAGQGKTWLILQIAKAAHAAGQRVLLICPEMARQAIARRYISMMLKVNYSSLRHGRLSSFNEKEVLQKIEALEIDDRISIVGDSFDFSLGSVESAVMEFKPTILLIDALYLIRMKGVSDRFESLALLANECKKMARRFKIPVIASVQLNRKAVGGKSDEVGLHTMALSDNLGWVADHVFIMLQDKDQKNDRIMEIKPAKTREEDSSRSILVNWKFDVHDFSEIENRSFSKPTTKKWGADKQVVDEKDEVQDIADDIPV